MKIQVELEDETVEEKKKLGTTWAHIVGLGILAFKDNPQLLNRIKAMEARLEKLELKVFLKMKE